MNSILKNLTSTTYNLPPNHGFSLVETLLASAVLALTVTALIGAVIYGRESTGVAGMLGRATYLAEEGLEAIRNLRDSAFTNLINGDHGLVVSGNIWTFSGTSDTTDNFMRTVAISTVDSVRKLVTSTITWQQTPSRSGSVVLTTYLTDWREGSSVSQCNSYCQSILYSSGTCRPDVPACTEHGETHEAGGDTYCTGGVSSDTCCCAP